LSFSKFFNFVEYVGLKEKTFAEVLKVFNKIPSKSEKIEALSLIIENAKNIRLITHYHHLINKTLSDLLIYSKKEGTIVEKLVLLKVINDEEIRRQLLLEDILKNDYIRSEWVLDVEFYDDDDELDDEFDISAYPKFIAKQISILSSVLEEIKGTELMRNNFDDLLKFINQSYDFDYKIKAVKKIYDNVKNSELLKVKYDEFLNIINKIIDEIKGIQRNIPDYIGCDDLKVSYTDYRLNLFSELLRNFKGTEFMKYIVHELLKSIKILDYRIVEGVDKLLENIKDTELLEESCNGVLDCIKNMKEPYYKKQTLSYFLEFYKNQEILKENFGIVINIAQEINDSWDKLEIVSDIINSIDEFKYNNELSDFMDNKYNLTENLIKNSLNYLKETKNVWFVFNDLPEKDGFDDFDPIIKYSDKIRHRIDRFLKLISTVNKTKFMKSNYELIKGIFLDLVNSLEKGKYWEKLGKDIYWEMLKEDYELIKIVFKSYFNEPEAKSTLYMVLDLFKQYFKEGKISKQLVYKILTIVSEYYIDNFNGKEMEYFLNSPNYSNKENIVIPSNNGFLIKYLTFLLLIHIYIRVLLDLDVENILEKEIKNFLIHATQNRLDEDRILSLFKNLNDSLNQLNTKQFLFDWLLRKKQMDYEPSNQPYLIADFFYGYFDTKKRPILSKSEIKKLLADLKSKSDKPSDSRSEIFNERAKSIHRVQIFELKTQISKLLKTQGKNQEEINHILNEMNDDLEKLLEYRFKLGK